jgi:hypothetical protein
MLYDKTCAGRFGLPGLTSSWWTGGHLYRALGRLDAFFGAATWTEALDWLAHFRRDSRIAEIQYWGHGKWGSVLLAGERLDARDLQEGAPRRPVLESIRERLIPRESLWWFRTCETFGTQAGHSFAKAWTSFFNSPAAGHTFLIGPWQSGLHSLRPDELPDWSVNEGCDDSGTRTQALWSKPTAPRTITCFHGQVPEGW